MVFYWRGGRSTFLHSVISQQGLDKYVWFLASKTNLYGYMKDCDIYVQPSRHAGFCIALSESLCFGLLPRILLVLKNN